MRSEQIKSLLPTAILLVASCGGGSSKEPEALGKTLADAPEGISINQLYDRTCFEELGCTWAFDTERAACGQEGIVCNESGDILEIRLSDKSLVGELPVGLESLDALKVLDLSHNRMYGGLPNELGNLAHLDVLNLENNNFSGEVPIQLESLVNLSELRLRDNSFICEPLVDYSEWAEYTDYYGFNCNPCNHPDDEVTPVFYESNGIESPIIGSPMGCSDKSEFQKSWKKVASTVTNPHPDIEVEDIYVYRSSSEYIYWSAFANNLSLDTTYCFIQAIDIKFFDAEENQISTHEYNQNAGEREYVEGEAFQLGGDRYPFITSTCLSPGTQGVFAGIEDAPNFFERLGSIRIDSIEVDDSTDRAVSPQAKIVNGGVYGLRKLREEYFRLNFSFKNTGAAIAHNLRSFVLLLNQNGEPLRWTYSSPISIDVPSEASVEQFMHVYDTYPSSSLLAFPLFDLDATLYQSVSTAASGDDASTNQMFELFRDRRDDLVESQHQRLIEGYP